MYSEDGFVQAGQLLVEIGRQAFIGLGELLAWKIERERAGDQASRDAIIARYAAAWGVRRSNLIKALVLVEKYPEIERPADQTPTATYEVLSGSDSAEEAEAGMQALCENGWTVQRVREAKALKRQGLTQAWFIPYLFYRDGAIWARGADGREVVVMERNPDRDELVELGIGLVRYRTGT